MSTVHWEVTWKTEKTKSCSTRITRFQGDISDGKKESPLHPSLSYKSDALRASCGFGCWGTEPVLALSGQAHEVLAFGSHRPEKVNGEGEGTDYLLGAMPTSCIVLMTIPRKRICVLQTNTTNLRDCLSRLHVCIFLPFLLSTNHRPVNIKSYTALNVQGCYL